MLNTNDVVPLYQQMQDILRERIRSGAIKPGEKLAAETELAREFSVSVITARKAVNELAAEGLLERKQGKGTFVTKPKIQRNLHQVISFSEACRLNGLTPGAKLLTCRLDVPEGPVQDQLELPTGEKVVFLSRLRFADGEPVQIETNHYPQHYEFLLREDLSNRSLFEILEERGYQRVVYSRREISIRRATAEQADLLQVARGEPLLMIHSVAYDARERPVYCGTQYINSERFQVTM